MRHKLRYFSHKDQTSISVSKKGLQAGMGAIVTYTILILVIILIMAVGRTTTPLLKTGSEAQACRIGSLSSQISNQFLETSYLDRVFTNSNFYSSCPITIYLAKHSDFRSLNRNDANRLLKTDYYTEEDFTGDEMATVSLEKFLSSRLVNCYERYDEFTVFPATFKIEPETILEQLMGGLRSVSFPNRQAASAPPVYCAPCAKIYFDDDFVEAYKDSQNYLSAERYLKANNLRVSDITLYDYIDSGRVKYEGTDIDLLDRYFFIPDSRPLAIVYYRRFDYKYTQDDLKGFMGPISFLGYVTQPLTSSRAESLYQDRVNEVRSQINSDTGLREMQIRAPADTKKILEIKREALGILSLFSYAASRVGLYDWFTPMKEATLEDEFGVALIPYETMVMQCDFIANSFGDFQVANPDLVIT